MIMELINKHLLGPSLYVPDSLAVTGGLSDSILIFKVPSLVDKVDAGWGVGASEHVVSEKGVANSGYNS